MPQQCCHSHAPLSHAACGNAQNAEHASKGGASRWLSTVGNTLFFGALGGTAYFGYYTLRYSSDDMERLLQERKKPDNDFPGSQVHACFTVVDSAYVTAYVHGMSFLWPWNTDLQGCQLMEYCLP